MKRLVLVAALLVAACGHKQEPEVRIVTQRVEVPIRVPCKVERPPTPAYAADAVSLDADIFELVKAILADRQQRSAREAEVSGAISRCE